MDQEKLVTFLYLLMRDELPTGRVVELINQATTWPDRTAVYTNKHLEAMARDYTNRILEVIPNP